MRTYCYKIILVVLVLCIPSFVSASTEVSGYIGTDTVWNSGGSPYVIESTVTLGAGVTLTIEQGVIVKFGANGQLDIFGNLITDSVVHDGIILTSLSDDVGGDTNNDGQATAPVASSWVGITFQLRSSGNLSGTTMRYAGKNGYIAMYNKGAILNLENVNFNRNGKNAFYQQGQSTTTVSNSVFSNNDTAMFIVDGSIIAKNNTFNQNGIGILTHTYPGIAQIENNIFSQNHYPLQLSLGQKTLIHSGNTFVNNDINAIQLMGETASDLTLDNHEGPYIGSFQISSGTTLTLSPGTILKFEKMGGISVLGNLVAAGTPENPVHFTSLMDDSVGGDTNNDGNSSFPSARDWYRLTVSSAGSLNFENTIVRYGGNSDGNSGFERYGAVILSVDSTVSISNSEITDSNTALLQSGGSFTISSSTLERNYMAINTTGSGSGSIHGSSFEDTINYAIYNQNPSGFQLSAQNNWWGDATGPYHETNIDGKRPYVSDGVDFNPWLVENPFTIPAIQACCSNVAFLPGLGGSRLYRPGIFGEDRLWEPNGLNDVSQLSLSSSTGESVLKDIYAKDLVDETYTRVDEWPGTNTYKTFSEYMDTALVNTGKIKEWKPLVYDWRLGLPEVINNGIVIGKDQETEKVSYLSATSTGYIIAELRRLADTSDTGKVTIIAHSNGGLVTKYLVKHLQDTNDPLLDKIDKIIFVAVPQLGTPEAVAALLHGTAKVGKSVARDFSEEMKSAYHLLPSQKYFDLVSTPVIEFSDDISKVNELKDLAGSSVADYSGLRDFMTGRGGVWTDPSKFDIDTPNVLDAALLDYSEQIHNSLDGFQIPEHIQFTQIAGVGLDTVRGIGYDDCDFPLCTDSLSHLDRELLQTKRGDGTVVVPSAVENSQGERIYVDIYKNNRFFARNRKHGSIFEIDDLQKTVASIISSTTIAYNDILKKEEPSISKSDVSYSFTLHSPLSLDLYDSEGRHTGLVSTTTEIRYAEEEIPNSYYKEFGEVKYAGSASDDPVIMRLVGQANGIFTLDIKKNEGENVVQSALYKDVPVNAGMVVTLKPLTAAENINTAEILVDVDGDGIIDTTISQGTGISPEEWIGYLKGYVRTLLITENKKNKLQKILVKLEKIIQKEKGCENKKKKETCEFRLKVKSDKIQNRLESVLQRFLIKGLITQDEFNQIKDIIKK